MIVLIIAKICEKFIFVVVGPVIKVLVIQRKSDVQRRSNQR